MAAFGGKRRNEDQDAGRRLSRETAKEKKKKDILGTVSPNITQTNKGVCVTASGFPRNNIKKGLCVCSHRLFTACTVKQE